MTWILENPFWVLLFGTTCAIGLAVTGLRLGRRSLLIGAGAVFVVTVLIVVLERSVETDSEKLRRTIQELAIEVENNRVEGIVEYVDPDEEEIIRRVRGEMPGYKFGRCTVLSIRDIAYDAPRSPGRAMVVFSVLVDVSLSVQPMEHTVTRRVILFFHRKSPQDPWLIYDYDHEPTGNGSKYLNDQGEAVFRERGSLRSSP